MSADCKYSLIFILFKLFDNFYMTRIDKIVNNNRLIEVFRSWNLGGSIDEEYFILWCHSSAFMDVTKHMDPWSYSINHCSQQILKHYKRLSGNITHCPHEPTWHPAFTPPALVSRTPWGGMWLIRISTLAGILDHFADSSVLGIWNAFPGFPYSPVQGVP